MSTLIFVGDWNLLGKFCSLHVTGTLRENLALCVRLKSCLRILLFASFGFLRYFSGSVGVKCTGSGELRSCSENVWTLV